MEYRHKRVVVGRNADGKSAVLSTTATNVQEEAGLFYRATLWSTNEVPVDNSIEGDRANIGVKREPPAGGALVRVLELQPDDPDKERAIARFMATNEKFGQKYQPTAEESARHPSMHRTDTLDIIFVFRGEIYLVTDVDEILCQEGDCIIIKGTNHGWSVRGTKPCMCMGVMINAHPLN